MNLEQLKLLTTTLSVEDKKELIQFLKDSIPKPKPFSVRKAILHAKALAGLPDLKIKAYRKDILQQTKKYGGDIDFEMALHLAIDSFLRNGEKTESPFWLVKEVPDDYGLDYNSITDNQISQVIHSFMNDGHSTLELITEKSKFPPENGESIQQYWIFLLKAKRFSSTLHWALVSRDGKEIYNYGYG